MDDHRPEADGRVPAGYDPELYRIRHSAAHVLAQAVRERFAADGDVRLGVGPPIEHGFYYDFELPRPATENDLRALEARMREILAGDHPFDVREVTPVDARVIFRNEPYKLELFDGLASREVDDDGASLPAGERVPITVYQHDTFVDLCRGPHVRSTGRIDPEAFGLLNVAGAYWRGDERRPILQRIHGTAWRRPNSTTFSGNAPKRSAAIIAGSEPSSSFSTSTRPRPACPIGCRRGSRS